MLQENAIRIAHPAFAEEEFLTIFRDPKMASNIGAEGKRVFEREAGATKVTVGEIQKIVSQRVTQ
jgi:hypothetical protein